MNHWKVTPSGEYPPEWITGQIQQDIYSRAGWKCEHCGMIFEPGSTQAKHARNAQGDPIILTVHHIDGDKGNCSWENLVALCQICHLKMHNQWGPGLVLPLEWHNRIPEWIEARGLDYQINPQLDLFAGLWD